MGLPARQRRTLGRIEIALRGSDPRLAALYAIFARLNRDEEMPRIEQLRHTVIVAWYRLRRTVSAFFGRLFGRRGHGPRRVRVVPRQRAVLFFPLALILAIVSIVYAARSSSGDTCSPTAAASQTATGQTTGSQTTGSQTTATQTVAGQKVPSPSVSPTCQPVSPYGPLYATGK
jgi:hypothetical protein